MQQNQPWWKWVLLGAFIGISFYIIPSTNNQNVASLLEATKNSKVVTVEEKIASPAKLPSSPPKSTLKTVSYKEVQASPFEVHIKQVYKNCQLEKKGLKFSTFEKASIGFFNLLKSKKIHKNNLLTIVDFDQASTKKRMYTIDLKKGKLIHHSLVSHGKNTGVNYATKFSNIEGSLQSSLGFYRTAGTYQGKHGYSLRLDGLEIGINHKARERAIVMHGANYVSDEFIRKEGRLGRSWGCPAVPYKDHQKIISTVKNGSCLYIHKNKDSYLSKSRYLNPNSVNQYFASIQNKYPKLPTNTVRAAP